jgi:hypothetical protein
MMVRSARCAAMPDGRLESRQGLTATTSTMRAFPSHWFQPRRTTMMGRLQMMMANAARPMEPTEFRSMSRTHYPDEARIFGIY